MSDSTARLRHKIGSAGDLQSVVRTMKVLAASNIAQYEQSVRALADYYRTVELGLWVCSRNSQAGGVGLSPAITNDAAVTGAVVFGSDQGLVGQFNESIADHAIHVLGGLAEKVHKVWAVGERVHARLVDAGLPLAGLFAVPNSVQAVTPLVGQILMDSEAGRGPDQLTELHLFYNHPTPAAGYESVSQRLLPLDDASRGQLVTLHWTTNNLPEVSGDPAATLRVLLREYLFISLFRACTESLASENSSRLSAMERADKNIDGLLENLRGTFNRVRQSSIDEELFDVIAGFEAGQAAGLLA